MINTGFIMLNREFLDWEWYTDVNCCKVFLHCLIKANYSPKKWKGILIDKGEFVTSYEVLATETGLTISKVRTALAKIENTEYITVTTTASFTKIRIMQIDNFLSEPNTRGVDIDKKLSDDLSLQENTAQSISILAKTSQTENNQISNTSHSDNKLLATTNTNTNNKDIKTRRKIFREKVFAHTNFNYKILESFFNYWSELDTQVEQMRFENQRFFEIDKRLEKWKLNERQNSVSTSNNKTASNR